MAYSLKSLKEELVSKNLANHGLVAWGQNSSVGAISSALSAKFAISMIENCKIAVFPFTNKEIKYSEAKAFDKSQLTSAKVSGLLGKKLTIKTNDGKTLTFPITQGAGDVKEILTKLGF